MLTVKHIDADGGEHVYEADEVRVERADPEPHMRGVNVKPADKRMATNIFYPFIGPDVPRPADGPTAQVLVMNSHGATVAKYLL